MFNRLRNYLITGAIVVSPLAITVFIIWSVFRFADRLLGPLIAKYLGLTIPGLGIASGIIILIFIGMVTSSYIVQKIRHIFEYWLQKVPFIGDLYGTLKKISEIIANVDHPAFQSVVLINLSDGIQIPGLLTNQNIEIWNDSADHEQQVSVFIPTAPNPVTGFVVLVPRRKIVVLDMSINDGIKFIISAGILNPGKKNGSGDPG